jgi:hypothetical protein
MLSIKSIFKFGSNKIFKCSSKKKLFEIANNMLKHKYDDFLE